MKKLFLTIVALSFFFAPTVLAEEITKYFVQIQVDEKGDLLIGEQIDYDFGDLERHGIYRNIPTRITQNGERKRLDFSDIQVVDEQSKPYVFEEIWSGGNLQIKIGHPDIYITGAHQYNIFYQVTKPILFDDTFDRYSWNAIGTEWTVPINRAGGTITLDEKFRGGVQAVRCYTGAYGSTETCNIQKISDTEYVFSVEGALMQEGVTIDVDIQKGIILPPTPEELQAAAIKKWWTAVIPVIIFALLYLRWYKKGRDPKGKHTIVTQFDPPQGLTPAEVGTLIDEKAQAKDVWAEIVNLAVMGYIRIIRNEKTGLFGKATYTLEQIKKPADLNNSFQEQLMLDLFSPSTKPEGQDEILAVVNLEDLKYKFAPKLRELQTNLYKYLVKAGYFVKDPQTTRWIYVGISIFFFAFAIAMLAVSFETDNFVPFVSILLSGVLFVAFAPLMAAKTPKGVDAKEHILGFKNYLQVAEKDRIDFHNAPEKNATTFEKFLPFAMVLGVETQWAKQFKDLEMQDPSWYRSTSGGHFTAMALATGLGDFSQSANSTLGTSHTSGGGGGGFSGGGGGGGGGGSW